jgi:hypothetical protein
MGMCVPYRFVLTILLTASGASACAAGGALSGESVLPYVDDPDAYAVYAAVISAEWQPLSTPLVIAAETHGLAHGQCSPTLDAGATGLGECGRGLPS